MSRDEEFRSMERALAQSSDECSDWRGLAEAIVSLDAMFEGGDLVVHDLAERVRAICERRGLS